MAGKPDEPRDPDPAGERLDRRHPGRTGQPGQTSMAIPGQQLGPDWTATAGSAVLASRTAGHLLDPDLRAGRLAGMAGDHRCFRRTAVWSGNGRHDRRGRRLYADCARCGGRGRRDRGGDRPHGCRNQSGLRGERGPPPPGAGGEVRGVVRRDGRLSGRYPPPQRSIRRPHGRSARDARSGRGRSRAPRRRRLRRGRPRLSSRCFQPRPALLFRARVGAQHGAGARSVRGAPRRNRDRGVVAAPLLRLRQPAGVRGGCGVVELLGHDNGLPRPVCRCWPCRSRRGPFLESAPSVRRRPVGRPLHGERRVRRHRSGRCGGGAQRHGPRCGVVAGSTGGLKPTADGGRDPAGSATDPGRRAGRGRVAGIRRSRRRPADFRGFFVGAGGRRGWSVGEYGDGEPGGTWDGDDLGDGNRPSRS